MYKVCLKLTALVSLLIVCNVAIALPFESFDPRSMAMGGTGVAVGDPSTAPFFNPAMLTASDPSKKYSFEFPIIGARLYDPSDMHNNLKSLSDNINTLSLSLDAVNAASGNTATPATIQQLPGNMNTLAGNIDKVNSSLAALSNQPLQGVFGLATVVGIPGKNWGFAFYADAWGAVGGTLEYNDHQTLFDLSTSVKSASTSLSSGAVACAAVQAGGAGATQANVQACLGAGDTLVNNKGTVNFSTSTGITSKIHVRGVAVEEAGLSISHNLVTSDHSWSLGVTPKVMNLQLFDALLAANNGTNTSNATGNDYLAKYNTVNFDMGVAKSYNNGWRTGVVVKNVIPQSFDFKRAPNPGDTPIAIGSKLNMNPQGRLGISHENAWSTVAFDLDLAKNNPAGLESKSQYAGLGGELSAWGWAQLRAGYRSDLVNKGQDLISLGFGLSPRIPYFKPHLDLAVTSSRDVLSNGWNNATQAGASLKLGFNF